VGSPTHMRDKQTARVDGSLYAKCLCDSETVSYVKGRAN
jgi:hypothetical protein